MRPGDVILGAPVEGRQRVRFRDLSGADELALFGCDYPAAIDWIAGRVAGDSRCIAGEAVARLPIGEGDRLFGALYQSFFGDRIELRQACRACPESFELALALDQLIPPAVEVPAETTLAGGTRLRPPSIGDLLAAAEGDDLVATVTLEAGSDDPGRVAEEVARIAPATVETIETTCPHCGAAQAILFDLPRYFLRCAEREREILLREAHLLARTYGWGLQDILGLKRAERHVLVRLATAAVAPRRLVRHA
jgi:hypothetical protein